MAIAEDLDRLDSPRDRAAEHTRTYLPSGGAEGHENTGVRTLVLATSGCRTGALRRTWLIYWATTVRAALPFLFRGRSVPRVEIAHGHRTARPP
jgi:hypothetical protein